MKGKLGFSEGYRAGLQGFRVQGSGFGARGLGFEVEEAKASPRGHNAPRHSLRVARIVGHHFGRP